MKILCAEKTYNFRYCSLNYSLGKAGLASSTDILNPNVTDGGHAGNADIYYKAKIFSFANKLPVKLTVSIFYSNVIKFIMNKVIQP